MATARVRIKELLNLRYDELIWDEQLVLRGAALDAILDSGTWDEAEEVVKKIWSMIQTQAEMRRRANKQ